MKKTIKSYVICIGGLIVIIIMALLLPNMVFYIQDSYRMANAESQYRGSYDVVSVQDTYEKDVRSRMERVAGTRWGKMAVSVENTNIDSQMFDTIMNEIMVQEYMMFWLTMAEDDLSEALDNVSIENLNVCERYVVYGDNYTEGVLLAFWYLKIYLPSIEGYIEFVVDSETYTIYYVELSALEEIEHIVYIYNTPEEGSSDITVYYEENKEETLSTDLPPVELKGMASNVASYYSMYYAEYYGVDADTLLFSDEKYEESITVMDDYITATYMLTYSPNNSLLFRVYAEYDEKGASNISIGLPLIRRLIQG